MKGSFGKSVRCLPLLIPILLLSGLFHGCMKELDLEHVTYGSLEDLGPIPLHPSIERVNDLLCVTYPDSLLWIFSYVTLCEENSEGRTILGNAAAMSGLIDDDVPELHWLCDDQGVVKEYLRYSEEPWQNGDSLVYLVPVGVMAGEYIQSGIFYARYDRTFTGLFYRNPVYSGTGFCLFYFRDFLGYPGHEIWEDAGMGWGVFSLDLDLIYPTERRTFAACKYLSDSQQFLFAISENYGWNPSLDQDDLTYMLESSSAPISYSSLPWENDSEETSIGNLSKCVIVPSNFQDKVFRFVNRGFRVYSSYLIENTWSWETQLFPDDWQAEWIRNVAVQDIYSSSIFLYFMNGTDDQIHLVNFDITG